MQNYFCASPKEADMKKGMQALPFALALIWVTLWIFNASAWASTHILVDRSGNRIVIKKPFHRIISLYAAHTENLFSLGLDKEIIGVSKDEVYPPKAMTKPVFSYHDDAERFLAVHPDLVLIRPMIARGYPNLVRELRENGIAVVSLQPRTVADIYTYWRDLGRLTGRERQAEGMINEFEAKLRHIRSLVKDIPVSKRKKVYFEAIHSRMKTFSPSSIAMFALKTAGGINVAKDAHAHHGTNIANYGKEHILSHADQIDVYLAQSGFMNHVTIRQIREEAGFELIKAVREGHIHIVDEKIVSRPTMRLLDGIYEIGRFLYPRRFNDVAALKSIPVLSRAQFAEMFFKMTNMPLKTPNYREDIQKRASARHRYGDFKDVDYTGRAYKFIETAVYRGIFPDVDKYAFHPDKPVKRSTIAYALFVYFDFPEVKKDIAIGDVGSADPFFEQIRTAVGLGLMNLTQKGLFRPDGSVSGMEAFRILSKALAL
jgi:iron complex transport system substrate-binding protein